MFLFFDDSGGAWQSGDTGSNYQIYKNADKLQFRYASGIAGGDSISWNDGMVLDTSGNVGIGTDNPSTLLHLNDGDITIARDTDDVIIGITSHRISGGSRNVLMFLLSIKCN